MRFSREPIRYICEAFMNKQHARKSHINEQQTRDICTVFLSERT